MGIYKLILTNKSDNYNLITGIVYSKECFTSDEFTNPAGIFTLELKQFPKVNSGNLGSQFITKYTLDISFDKPNAGFGEIFTNSRGFSIGGTYKLIGGTFFDLSPLGMPFGKYINQAVNIGYMSTYSIDGGKVLLDIIKKNDTDGYECILKLD
jgi:hypothetical protein